MTERRWFVGILLLFVSIGVQAERHGEIRSIDGQTQAYLEDISSFVSPEAFWDHYVEGSTGKHWGSSREYPPYVEVSELDTFIVELDSGTCLMEFFHNRWRRANDVRRWDPQFNTVGGCADVFK